MMDVMIFAFTGDADGTGAEARQFAIIHLQPVIIGQQPVHGNQFKIVVVAFRIIAAKGPFMEIQSRFGIRTLDAHSGNADIFF